MPSSLNTKTALLLLPALTAPALAHQHHKRPPPPDNVVVNGNTTSVSFETPCLWGCSTEDGQESRIVFDFQAEGSNTACGEGTFTLNGQKLLQEWSSKGQGSGEGSLVLDLADGRGERDVNASWQSTCLKPRHKKHGKFDDKKRRRVKRHDGWEKGEHYEGKLEHKALMQAFTFTIHSIGDVQVPEDFGFQIFLRHGPQFEILNIEQLPKEFDADFDHEKGDCRFGGPPGVADLTKAFAAELKECSGLNCVFSAFSHKGMELFDLLNMALRNGPPRDPPFHGGPHGGPHEWDGPHGPHGPYHHQHDFEDEDFHHRDHPHPHGPGPHEEDFEHHGPPDDFHHHPHPHDEDFDHYEHHGPPGDFHHHPHPHDEDFEHFEHHGPPGDFHAHGEDKDDKHARPETEDFDPHKHEGEHRHHDMGDRPDFEDEGDRHHGHHPHWNPNFHGGPDDFEEPDHRGPPHGPHPPFHGGPPHVKHNETEHPHPPPPPPPPPPHGPDGPHPPPPHDGPHPPPPPHGHPPPPGHGPDHGPGGPPGPFGFRLNAFNAIAALLLFVTGVGLLVKIVRNGCSLRRREQQQRPGQMRRVDHHHGWNMWWNRYREPMSRQDYEEKASLILEQEDVLEDAMEVEITSIVQQTAPQTSEVHVVEEGRYAPRDSSLNYPSSVASSTAIMTPSTASSLDAEPSENEPMLPSYEEEINDEIHVVDGFNYTPSNSEDGASDRGSVFTPSAASVIDQKR